MITEIKKEIISKIQKYSIEKLLSQGKRLDGRSLFEYREIKIYANPIEKANGSSLVMLGNTKVMVGIKLSVGEPFPDTPNEGLFIMHAELTPIASPYFELGPPSDYSIELARVVDRAIRSAEMIDLEKLVIIPGKKVWMLNIDIYPIDDDGNLIDASALGVIAALLSTELPKAEIVDEENGVIEIIKDETTPLPVRGIPSVVTFSKVGDYIIVDPTYIEENVSSARITWGFTHKGEICSIQKGESGGFKLEEIKLSIDVGLKKAEELRNKVTNQLAKNPRGPEVWEIIFGKSD
mgnify:CR=1 FL=1